MIKTRIEEVQLQFLTGNTELTHLKVSNDQLIVTTQRTIYRINLQDPAIVNHFDCPLSKELETIMNVHVSPMGSVILIRTNFGRYMLLKDGEFTQLNKIKNLDLSSLHWINETTFLMGIKKTPKLYRVELTGKDITTKLWYENKKLSGGIDGIAYWEGSLLLAIKDNILYWRDVTNMKFPLVLPDESEQFERLKHHAIKKFDSYNGLFAWVTSNGIVFGDLKEKQMEKDPASNNFGKFLSSSKVLLNFELPDYQNDKDHLIKDIVLTAFHILLLRKNTVTMVSQLNNDVVFHETIPRHQLTGSNTDSNEKFLGLVRDSVKETFWCFSNINVFEIIIENEPNSVWNLLVRDNKFDKALSLKGLTVREIESVKLSKAMYLFHTAKDFHSAAQTLGSMKDLSHFGEIALNFLQIKDYNDLNVILIKQLDNVPWKSTQVVLSSWIIWNFMKQLNDIELKINTTKPASTDEDNLLNWNLKLKEKSNELTKFLESHLEKLDNETVYQIMSKQNRQNELLIFANLINDMKFLLSFWIDQGNWYESLKILLTINNHDLVYKYSLILLLNSPEATVSTWMKIKDLDPNKLIPTILKFFTNWQNNSKLIPNISEYPENYSLTYLKWCVREVPKMCNPIVYNSILYMMITDPRNDMILENDIIKFMKSNENKFDLNFQLRLSLKFKKTKTSIFLLTRLNLFEDAIDLALKNNLIDDCKVIVNDEILIEDYKLRKRLWLKIAKHLLLSMKDIDIKQLIRTILNDSNEILTIKDLLPFFNEYTTIANLKEELIKFLENHNMKMNEISEDIINSKNLKVEINTEISKFNEIYRILEPGKSCDECGKFLQIKKFIVFPCGHCFHWNCIIRVILNSNDYNLRQKTENFLKAKNKHNLNDLENIIVEKCGLCSDININKIDQPISIDETELAKWNE
ncbi:tethering complex subunit [Saccharomyces cerevisiae]|nr:Pep3p [Saccharomyces cerevisiae YJM1419]AJV66351.1 Pep3p [Saccharomyces cerevisiae YJM1450]KZV09393.1 PEP3 [Saccharomyces cerevisiae]CAI4618355.1 BDF_1d_G0036540.mRNA.1.CDS.1 [Saccharomyces cerevisiae]CAI4622360.1 BDC_1c_G0036610.mRNA.1.CDS.1 [Saccharomyces cerevisiae]